MGQWWGVVGWVGGMDAVRRGRPPPPPVCRAVKPKLRTVRLLGRLIHRHSARVVATGGMEDGACMGDEYPSQRGVTAEQGERKLLGNY